MAIVGYEYRSRLTGDVDWGEWVDAGDVLAASVDGLEAGTEHDFQVRPYDQEGVRGELSNIATASTTGIPMPNQWLRPEELTSSGYANNAQITVWVDHSSSHVDADGLYSPAGISAGPICKT